MDGSISGKQINHMLYADDLCIISLFSVSQCAMRSITFNVKKNQYASLLDVI